MHLHYARQDPEFPPVNSEIGGEVPASPTLIEGGEVTITDTDTGVPIDTLIPPPPDAATTSLPSPGGEETPGTTDSSTGVTENPAPTTSAETITPPDLTESTTVPLTPISESTLPTSTPSPFTSTFETTPTPESTESTTDSFTTITTTINGTPTTLVSPVTTSLSGSGNTNGGSSRTGLIAGLTSGLLALLIILLCAAIAVRKKRRQREAEVLIVERKRREGRGLLDGEGFDDDRYGDHGRNPHSVGGSVGESTDTSPYPRSMSPILRTRMSDAGSIFRENVWPPPTSELVDPMVQASSQVDLSSVVDEVMGPRHQNSDGSADSSTPLMANPFGSTHSRGPSLSSQYMDLTSQSMPSLHPSIGSYPSFAFASSGSLPHEGIVVNPVTQPPVLLASLTTSPTSTQHPLSARNSFDVSTSTSSTSSSALSHSPPISQTSLPVRGSTLPKKSSPLARRLSQDAKVWLTGAPAGKHATT